MDWKGKRVLVTGAGGFIGSHLVERLAGLGAEVRAFYRYNALDSRGWLEECGDLGDRVTALAGDVCDRDRVRQAMDGAEIVFHLASLIAIPYSYHAPTMYVRTNVEGTVTLLQTAREMGVWRFVHTSTSEVYGTARYVPMDEGHPLQGQSPYAASKIGADKMVEAFFLSFGLPAVTVRPFNTFGPRQSARAVIPTILTQAMTGREVRLGNLGPTRDFSYVSNTVDGFLLAASTSDVLGQTFNLGSGEEIEIGAIVPLIGDILGREIRPVWEEERVRPGPGEVRRLLADTQKARTLLGWRPEVGLREGLMKTAHWIGRHLDRYRPERYTL